MSEIWWKLSGRLTFRSKIVEIIIDRRATCSSVNTSEIFCRFLRWSSSQVSLMTHCITVIKTSWTWSPTVQRGYGNSKVAFADFSTTTTTTKKQITFLKKLYFEPFQRCWHFKMLISARVVPCVWQIALPISVEMPARIPHWELGHTHWWSRQCKCYTAPSNGTQLSGSWEDEQKRIKQNGFRVFQVGGLWIDVSLCSDSSMSQCSGSQTGYLRGWP